jgi:hypothetical protein
MYSFLNRDKNNIDTSKGQIISLAFPSQEDLPPSSYGYHTNNVFQGFPPLMSDARSLIASWQPESFTNDRIVRENSIQSNWQYRQYLTNNADKLMKQNFSESANDIGFVDHTSASQPYGAPITFSGYNDTQRPLNTADSDLKRLYLSREELNSRRIAPVLTQEELLRVLSSKNIV